MMTEEKTIYQNRTVEAVILTIRGQKVILDAALARIYGVSTKVLNQAIKRNAERFPPDFMFALTGEEKTEVVTNCDHLAKLKFSPVLPYVFTEHGAIMAATVLNSPQAVQMSVFVVRAFIRMRVALADNRELALKLAALEREIKARMDVHESAIVDTLRRLIDFIDPPALPETPAKQIGFQVKESSVRYIVKRHKRRRTENEELKR
jgi:hypothetical protein